MSKKDSKKDGSKQSVVPEVKHPEEDRAREAWAKISPRAAAIAAALVKPVRTDVPGAVSIALNAVPVVQGFRAAIVKHMPLHSIACVDDLETLAQATWHVYVTHSPESAPKILRGLIDEGTPLRARLARAAASLADYESSLAARVAEIAEPQGGRTEDLAQDLAAYADLFTVHWAKAEGRTAVTRADLTRALVLSLQIVTAGNAGKKPAVPENDGTTPVQRCFALLAEAYDQCRRAVSYLRWSEGDVNALLPSLYARGGGGSGGGSGGGDEGEKGGDGEDDKKPTE